MWWLLACTQTATLGVGPDEVGAWDDPPVDDSPVSLDSLTPPVETGDSEGDTGDEGCPDVEDDAERYADWFDPSRVHTLALTMSDAAMTALAVDPGEYVAADAEIDGHPFPGVGVRWRGPTDQMRWDGKPGFRIGLRSLDACETWGGLTHLTLDGMSEDAAVGRIVVENAALEAMGRLAPRATYVQVTLNGESFGLYANVETIDARFLVHHGLDPDSVVWEGTDGADFTPGSVDEWDDVDSEGDPTAIASLAALLQSADEDLWGAADVWADMEDFVAFWGAQAALGDASSYPYDTDDVFAIQDPTDPRLRLIPWNLDAGWDPEFGYDHVDGALGLRCVYDTTCATALGLAISAAADAVEGAGVPDLAAAAFEVSDAALDDDPNRTTSAQDVRAARVLLLDSIAAWPGLLREQVGS